MKIENFEQIEKKSAGKPGAFESIEPTEDIEKIRFENIVEILKSLDDKWFPTFMKLFSAFENPESKKDSSIESTENTIEKIEHSEKSIVDDIGEVDLEIIANKVSDTVVERIKEDPELKEVIRQESSNFGKGVGSSVVGSVIVKAISSALALL